jgi:putative ABC transport system permease protein
MTRHGKRALDGIDADIGDHIERETQDNIERGTTPEEAHRQAMLAFGSVALAKEDTRAGVLAFAVTQRTQEIGVRMALGAQRGQVLLLVLRKGLILTALGVALGLAGAAGGTRFLQGMLFGITPLDPKTFTAVALTFGFVATCACYVPARRATRVDPMVALRSE